MALGFICLAVRTVEAEDENVALTLAPELVNRAIQNVGLKITVKEIK